MAFSLPISLLISALQDFSEVGVKSDSRLSLTTVFQPLTAFSWGKPFWLPLASRSATVFPHTASGSS